MINRSLLLIAIAFVPAITYSVPPVHSNNQKKFFAQTGDAACTGLRGLLADAYALNQSTMRTKVLVASVQRAVDFCNERKEAIDLHEKTGVFEQQEILRLADNNAIGLLGMLHAEYRKERAQQEFEKTPASPR